MGWWHELMRYWVKTPRFFPILFPNIVWKLASKQPKLYLTFDDGPTEEVTYKILSILISLILGFLLFLKISINFGT